MKSTQPQEEVEQTTAHLAVSSSDVKPMMEIAPLKMETKPAQMQALNWVQVLDGPKKNQRGRDL